MKVFFEKENKTKKNKRNGTEKIFGVKNKKTNKKEEKKREKKGKIIETKEKQRK